MSDISVNGEITKEYHNDNGRLVQLTKADGSQICYFPITLCHAVFNSAGTSLHDILSAFSTALGEAVKKTDKIKFSRPSNIQPTEEIYNANSGSFALLGGEKEGTYTIEELFYIMQQWGKLIDKKASAYDPINTNNVGIIAAHKAINDGNGDDIRETYARKDEINKAVIPKGSVATWRDLKDKSASQLSSLAPGYMYTVMETTPGEDSQWYYVYYPELDEKNNPVWRRYTADNDEGYERIEVKANDDFVFLGKPYSVIKYDNNGQPEINSETGKVVTIQWPDKDEHGNPLKEDAYWQYVGGKIDTSSFALKSETPSVIVGPEVSYHINLEGVWHTNHE